MSTPLQLERSSIQSVGREFWEECKTFVGCLVRPARELTYGLSLSIGYDGFFYLDETRIIRTLDLYLERFAVGREDPPDVRLHSEQLYEIPTNTTELNDYVLKLGMMGLMHLKCIFQIPQASFLIFW